MLPGELCVADRIAGSGVGVSLGSQPMLQGIKNPEQWRVPVLLTQTTWDGIIVPHHDHLCYFQTLEQHRECPGRRFEC